MPKHSSLKRAEHICAFNFGAEDFPGLQQACVRTHKVVKTLIMVNNYSVQTLLSSRLLTKNLKSKIYNTTILSIGLYGCETWSLTLRLECRLRIFENRILRRMFGPKRDESEEVNKAP